MVYESILGVMMWVVMFGLTLVVGSSMVLLYNSLQKPDTDMHVQLSQFGYDEFYDASDNL